MALLILAAGSAVLTSWGTKNNKISNPFLPRLVSIMNIVWISFLT